MLDLPKHFDMNEWFLIISLLVLGGLSWRLPKRFPAIISLVLYAIGPTMAVNVDFLLGGPPVDVYNINDGSSYELFDLLLYILYAPFSYLFIYFLDKWRVRGWGYPFYVLMFSALGMAYERLSVICHVFNYKQWNLGYSFVVYVGIQSIYVGLAAYFKWAYNRSRRPDVPEWQ